MCAPIPACAPVSSEQTRGSAPTGLDYGIGRYHNNPMEMVGHDDECVGLHVWEFVMPFGPPFFHHPSRLVQPHLPIHHLAEQTGPILGHEGDEIRAGPGIIIPLQPNAAAVMQVVVIRRDNKTPKF